jgi:LmbE family N-acetylglucosaminyl deacetylase
MLRACRFPLLFCLSVCLGLFPSQVAAKSIMVIAPHPDDEVLMAGGIIRRAIAAGDTVKVVVITNGDLAGAAAGLTRQAESVNALALLGVAEADIIFLGYGDAALADLLNHPSATQVLVSPAGRTATYGNRGLGGVDYHTFIHGTPGPYNRLTVQDDVRRVINTYRPDEIYIPSLYDTHSDHHGSYLLVVEALTGLKRSGVAYSPMLFEGMIHAPCSGSCSPLWPLPAFTPWAPFPKPAGLDATPLTWAWIESVTVPVEMLDPNPATNLKLRAIARYVTQQDPFLDAFVKSNEFFWRHDFSNLALTATVSASSESAATLQTRDRAVDGLVSGEPSDLLRYYREWVAPGQTAGAWIRLDWATARQVSQIRLYDRPNTSDNILSGTLTFSDGSTIAVGALPSQGAGLIVQFPVRTTTSVTFRIDTAAGVDTGLAEIEVFGPSTSIPSNDSPIIVNAATASPSSIADNQTSSLSVGASDPDGDVLLYTWTTTGGSISGHGATVSFSPSIVTVPTDVTITATVSDPIGGFDSSDVVVRVAPSYANNIAGFAAVTVSSENAADGQLGVKAIDGVIDGYDGSPGDYTREWATLGETSGAFIRLTWPSPYTINEVRLYDRPNSTDRILAGVIELSDGTSIAVGSLPNNGSRLTVPVPGRTATWLRFRITSAAGSNTGLAELEVIGGPGSPGTNPDPFTFTPQTAVAPGTVAVSNAVTITGITQPSPISVSGGEYSIGAQAFTNIAGVITNGQSVRLRQTASSNHNTTTIARLTIGSISGDFSVTTAAPPPDTTPNAFTFTAQSGVTPGAVVVSNVITVSGINAATPISIQGGEYSVAGGAYTSTAGSVTNGQTVTVRQTASSSFSTSTTATLTIGGVSAGFEVTTGAQDTTPNAFTFTARTGIVPGTLVVSNAVTVSGINSPAPISVVGGEYSINGAAFTAAAGTVANGQAVTVRQTASATSNTTTVATLTIGGVSAGFSVTTGDITPNAFTFTAQTNVAVNTVVISNSITVGGVTLPAPISVVGGEYSIGTAAFTAAAGTVTNGQTVRVRVTSSASSNTTTTATLTIGGVSASFNVTTLTMDTTPNAFAFTAQTGVTPGTVVTSNSITVGGITAPAPISVTGGEYSIGAGAFTATAGTVTNGQTVRVRQTASTSFSTTTTATLTIGGVSGAFNVTTVAMDTTPNAFAFTAQTGVAPGILVTSNSITVGGINAPAPISVVGGEYSIGAGAFTAVAGTVSNGQTVRVRQTSAASYSTTTTATLTIGTVSAAFNVTTTAPPDTTPDPFVFTARTDATRGSTYTSNSITVTGINQPTPISVVGGLYSISGGGFTNVAGTVTNGQTVRVRVTASTQFSTTTTATLTIGGISAQFNVTTLAADTTPNAFSFPSQTGVTPGALVTSTSDRISGINTAAPISVVNGQYRINNGAWTATPGTVSNNQNVQVRHTASASRGTSTTTTLTVGGVTATFTSTTAN